MRADVIAEGYGYGKTAGQVTAGRKIMADAHVRNSSVQMTCMKKQKEIIRGHIFFCFALLDLILFNHY
jgi:hypothetical protein